MTSYFDVEDQPPPEEFDDGFDERPPIPDTLDLIIERGAMISIHAAEQYAGIEKARREAHADAAQERYTDTEIIERSLRLELAMGLGITEYAAGMLIVEAEALVNRYPAVLDSLWGARINQRHVRDLIAALDAVEPEYRDRLIGPAVELAESQPVGKFRRKLRKLIDTVRAATQTERHEKALESRRVVLEPAEDGMAWLHILMPAVEARAIHNRVTAFGKVLAKEEGETRTLDQLRSDVVCDLLIDGDTSTLPKKARGIRATVVVTVPALVLLDVDGEGDRVATVEGVGPIPIERARELCGSADGWMRVLTHPETGVVLSVGRKKYRPPPELQRLVRWRSETCMAPGCNIPAARCEIDHNISWESGGETKLTNLAPLCTGHHHVKHHGRWCVVQIEGSGGAMLWISPTGRRYRVEPERRVPVFVPAFVRAADDKAPF